MSKHSMLVGLAMCLGCSDDDRSSDAALADSSLDATDATVDAVPDAPTDDASVFDPRGSDFAIQGRWTVSGGDPTLLSCQASGIERVALTFINDGEAIVLPELTADCADGSFLTGAEFQFGAYEFQWASLTGNEATLVGTARTFTVGPPTTLVEVPPGQFP